MNTATEDLCDLCGQTFESEAGPRGKDAMERALPKFPLPSRLGVWGAS